ncbi:MAG: NAD(P)-dependent oxidoreductase [Candidatus Magasanikbacteria bacterium]|nr:NAD(P)-dependent oxidoreductase [Candidatus Magasanikbacteria bacterium]
MKVQHVLVTGATGFIGSHLVAELLESGCVVSVIVRAHSDTWRIKDVLQHENIKIYSDTLEDMERAFVEQSIDCVVHLAAKYIKYHSSSAEAKQLMDANIVFPATLLDIMIKYNVQSIVSAGSFFEYDLEHKSILSESSPVKPYNLYARTKLMVHDLLGDYARWYGLSSVYLRIFSAYGPKDNEKLFSYLIKNFIDKKEIQLTPSEQQWNFTYVSDVVDAFIKAIDFSISKKSNHVVFNVGSNKPVSIKNIIHILEDKLAISGLVRYDKPYQKNEIFYVSCDGKKAHDELGWIAKIGIEEGLQKTIDYHLNFKKL